MDNSIQNKFIMNILNVNDKDIETLECVDDKDGNLVVYVTLNKKDKDVCPVCGKPGRVHGYTNKNLKHSIFANRSCNLIFKQRRYKCLKCDLTFSESNPFANRNDKVTHETKINVLKDLKRANVTYNQVAQRYNITATEVQRIFDKYVNIAPHNMPTTLSIDEHYFPNSDNDGLFMFIMMNFETGEIIDIYPDRRKNYLISKFSAIKNRTYDDLTHTSELSRVKYVSMDLNDYYRQVCKLYFHSSIICADEFHVIKNLNNFFDDIRNILFEAFPELEKAYELKENYIYFNRNCNLDNAKEELEKQIEAFKNCEIAEYKNFYTLLTNWKDEIVNSFIVVNGKRINNSYIESRNRTIDTLMYNANGLTNFKRSRNRMMYCINKNDTFSLK